MAEETEHVPGQKRLITRRRFLTLSGASAVGVVAYAGAFDPHHLEITHHTIRLQKLSPAFDGLRIAQLSDIHYEQFTQPGFVREVVDQVNRIQPDVVLLTGDYISEGPMPNHFGAESSVPCAETLSKIECRNRWSVLGNHDTHVDPTMVTEALESHGIPVLRNQHIPFERNGARIWISGVADVSLGNPDLDRAVPKVAPSAQEPVILMAHEPDYADHVARHGGVDLMLSGHTHGGQIRLPVVGAIYTPPLGRKYIEGHFSLPNDLQLYVNRGVGVVGVPFRVLCRPELTILTLRSAGPSAPASKL